MTAKTDAAKSDKRVNKSAFIRGFSPSTPAAEIVSKAKEAGFELTPKFIWTVQSEMRVGGKASGKKAKKTARKAIKAAKSVAATAVSTTPARQKVSRPVTAMKTKPGVAQVRTTSSSSSAEQKLRSLIVELGTARADEIYRTVRLQLNALVGQA